LTAACDALFAEQPPSQDDLLAAKRARVAGRLEDLTRYLTLQAEVAAK